jgi:NAD-dependent deacetylase
MDAVGQLEKIIAESRRIVFFGGAGVSTESDIPDFRSQGGLCGQKYAYPPEEILSHTFFMRHTARFFDFYRQYMLFPDALPNAAHRTLAEMEEKGRLDCVITQNIDGLHQKAGSQNVLELHGSVQRNVCMDCARRYGLAHILHTTGIPRCGCGGIVKPDVVLYEEPLNGDVLARALAALRSADLVIVGGTSLAVYPAAGLLDGLSGRIALINRAPTRLDARADLAIAGSIGEILGRIAVAG